MLELWSIKADEPIAIASQLGQGADIKEVEFAADRNVLFALGNDGSVFAWEGNPSDGRWINSLGKPDSKIAVSENGTYFALTNKGDTAIIRDVRDPTFQMWSSHDSEALDLTFANNQLITVSGNEVVVWEYLGGPAAPPPF